MSLGVIGGSGLYRTGIIENSAQRTVLTPYGPAALTTGTCRGQRLAFVARHGSDHSIPPHRVNYRANIWALAHLGATRILGTAAVGSLNPHMKPGHYVLLNQFIDFTRGRDSTFFDGTEPGVRHMDMTEPYCPALRTLIGRSMLAAGLAAHECGVYICTEGPRFETPAEIRMFRAWGADVVGMTNVPEVVLAREMGLCYAALAVVTNMAAGMTGRVLTHEEVVEVMDSSRSGLEQIMAAVASGFGALPGCDCPAPPVTMGKEESD